MRGTATVRSEPVAWRLSCRECGRNRPLRAATSTPVQTQSKPTSSSLVSDFSVSGGRIRCVRRVNRFISVAFLAMTKHPPCSKIKRDDVFVPSALRVSHRVVRGTSTEFSRGSGIA
jgi:hypothetical protein